MANYTKLVDFAAKDALASGNPAKIILGTEINTEFANIATAIATKEDTANKGVANGYAGLDSGARLTKALQHASTAYLDAAANFTAGLQSGGAAVIVSGGALGTPSSGTLTNCTFPTLNQNTSGNAATATSASTAVTLTGLTASITELNYTDGVTSAIQTQLDAKLASSGYTAADVLSKLLTVDGAGSGLDADTVDGQSSAIFAFRANNLSDLASASTARTNLGLGTLATQSGTFSGTSSGTNTGDQTNISGNAATVTTNANLTGDVTSSGNSTTLTAAAVAARNYNIVGKTGVAKTLSTSAASGGADGDIWYRY